MGQREILWCSIKVILICQILSLSVQRAQGQLDLPGPPYPDRYGRNRWGVKYDPEQHGPMYEKVVGSSRQRNHYRRPPRRPFRRPGYEKDADSFWSPAKVRPHRVRSQRHRETRFYGNDLEQHRPRSYLKAYRSHETTSPITVKEQKFWDSWNSWYKTQKDQKALHALEALRDAKVQAKDPETATPVTIYIDMDDELKYLEIAKPDENDYKYKDAKDCHEGGWKKTRDYYLNRMKGAYSKAKSLVSFEIGDAEEAADDTPKTKAEAEGGWPVFTTIGKGLDAANGAMRGMRKIVTSSVIGTGVKYGGKMAMDAVMNAGTSALTTAIKTATFG